MNTNQKAAKTATTTAKPAAGATAAKSTIAVTFNSKAEDRGPQTLEEGDHVVTLDSVAFIAKAPQTDEYTDPTPQLEILCKDSSTGRKMRWWPNLVGYVRFDELTEEHTNAIDPKLLNIKVTDWNKMKFEDRKNAAFTASDRDNYAIDMTSKTRILDEQRTSDAQSILAKAALHAGAVAEGDEIESVEAIMDLLSNATIGVHVSPNAQDKMRVEYTMPVDKVEVAEENNG